MMPYSFDPAPLTYHALAPNFSLESVSGQTVTRSQFRNKHGLALLFLQLTPEAIALLEQIGQDEAEYLELNARVIGIVRAQREALAGLAARLKPLIMLLADPEGTAWKAYTGTDRAGFAVFILDMYGGVDSQRVAALPGALPNAAEILEWMRATQYRCNI
jgi:peroxiredoxin